MTHSLVSLAPEAIAANAFKLIGSDWMLITAGTGKSYNMMTAAWGGLGVLWSKPVAYVVIRPGRYTFEFVEKHDVFSLNFFAEKDRGILNLCGTKSGRDINKMNVPGLTPCETDSGTIYFAEAKLVLECRKIYYQDMLPEHFLVPDIQEWYPEKDYHRMYVGQIISCLAAKP